MTHRPEEAQMPRNGAERQLFEVWCAVLEHSSFGVTDSFYDVGGDSLSAVQALARIEEEFGVNLPPTQFYHTPTIEKLAELLDLNSATPKPGEEQQMLLFKMSEGTTGKPLFCFPGSGGNVSNFFPLAARLGPEQGVYVLLYSALEEAVPLSTMEQLAASCIRGIKLVQPTGPYFLGGHSFGGSVAYEVAQQLRAVGDEVAMLALWEADLKTDPLLLPQLGLLRTLLNVRAVTLPRQMKVNYLLRRLAGFMKPPMDGGPNAGKSAEDAKNAVMDKIFRFQIAATEIHYQYQVHPYDGHFTVYAAAATPRFGDLSRWMRLARGGFHAHSVPGDHSSMMQEPNVGVLAAILQQDLGRLGRVGAAGES